MFASVFSTLWLPDFSETATGPEPKKRLSTPVFIGDAVLPYGRDTMLLEIMRKDQKSKEDQP